MRVFLVNAGETEMCVIVDGKLVLADSDEGENEKWPARKVAKILAEVLGCKVELWDWKPAGLGWTHEDLVSDMELYARQFPEKKKR